MKTRLTFVLLAVLTIFLVVGLLSRLQTPSASVAASGTPTQPPPPTEPPPSPTRSRLSQSPTTIPLRPTYTSIPGETPETIDTPTLLPIDTPTLLPPDTQPAPIFTETLILFATATSTPNGGTATPPVPVAYAIDGEPQTCYKGPSLAYIKMDAFKIARIVGKDLAEQWWFLLIDKGQGLYVSCWVSSDQVTTGGNLASLSVTEAELPQITRVQVSVPGQAETGAEYVQTIACDTGLTNTTIRFTGQIFTDGPLADLGYVWTTDAHVRFQVKHTSVKAWDAPAQVEVDLPVPSKAGSYSLSLRTTFPTEMLDELRFTVKCK